MMIDLREHVRPRDAGREDVQPPELLHVIHAVAAGAAQLSPCFMRRAIDQFSSCQNHFVGRRAGDERDQPTPDAGEELIAREREVVTLAARGLTNCEIAQRLIVSPATVKTHVSRAMSKPGARHRAALVAMAYQTGLVKATETPNEGEHRDERDPANRDRRFLREARPETQVRRQPEACGPSVSLA
jgi:DNA-binding NarL/FixJ family response regulator